MATLILAIQTRGDSWDEIDSEAKTDLTRWIYSGARPQAEQDQLLASLKSNLGFSPFTGRVVTIGVYDVERKTGIVYYEGDTDDPEVQSGAYTYRARTEAQMLEDMWLGATSYNRFVTYNGRRFAIPFLLIRSMAHNLRPSVELLTHRYLDRQVGAQHIDLLDMLTYYGALSKKPSLHTACRVCGIAYENSTQLSEPTPAQQTQESVTATTELYERWLQYLAPAHFLAQES